MAEKTYFLTRVCLFRKLLTISEIFRSTLIGGDIGVRTNECLGSLAAYTPQRSRKDQLFVK